MRNTLIGALTLGWCVPSTTPAANTYVPMQQARDRAALCDVLDDVPTAPPPQQEASTAPASDLPMEDPTSNLSAALYEEHAARMRAEAEAQDRTNRLRVAQEQLAEYAEQKHSDSERLLQQAESLVSAWQSAMSAASPAAAHGGDGDDVGAAGGDGDAAGAIGDGGGASSSNGAKGSGAGSSSTKALLEQMMRLREQLEESASEAKAFAAQQKADVETLKRSSQQADLPADQDTEMKRPRDAVMNGASTTEDTVGESDAVSNSSSSSDDTQNEGSGVPGVLAGHHNFLERAKYVPLRLQQEERRLLRLLEAALSVSEYTDKVDVLAWRNKSQRVHAQIKDICAILSGLVVAQDYRRGQELIRDRDFEHNADFFQAVFEVGRRYKVMNPDKMRSEYGKLLYMLMDSSDSHIQELLGFKCVKPLVTVASVLESKNGLRLLEDPLITTATAEIIAGDRPRYEVQKDIKVKERAREVLAKRYCHAGLSQEVILTCLYSLSDNNSYLLFNRDPIDTMIKFFRQYFQPNSVEAGFSLAIHGGRDGARLTHSHERQYHYVLQSLTLWREISTEMFKLWYLAETDMLRESNGYRLCDTGQGLNRVQSAPNVSKAMHTIVNRCQAQIGSWVGSAVVHLGDHAVPNALTFIDKYTQVPRILNPVVMVMQQLPQLARDPHLCDYINETFGGVEQCRKTILVDFCRHAFDGSGADNFYDAGSCIDGRLTSAWNWCSKLEKKPFFHVFRMAGFTSFEAF